VVEGRLKVEIKSYGQIAYEAYCECRDSKSFDGKALPKWTDQLEELQHAWEEAGEAVAYEALQRV
jgi:hypothetical protein